jgi:ankyrin repeat protein
LFDKFDINYRSSSRSGSTALMIACMQAHTSQIHELIDYGLMREQWPLLSLRDDIGDTILDLAADAGCLDQLKKILRFLVAMACCECPVETLRNGICSRIARQGSLEGNTLEAAAADPSCRWGEKLRCLKWPANDALKDIDDRIQNRDVDDLVASRVMNNSTWLEWGNPSIDFIGLRVA